MNEHHRQVVIEHEGESAEVDESIAPLILALWRRGYRTASSCEDFEFATEQPIAYVYFSRRTEGEDFASFLPNHRLMEIESPDDPWYPLDGIGIVFPREDLAEATAVAQLMERERHDPTLVRASVGLNRAQRRAQRYGR